MIHAKSLIRRLAYVPWLLAFGLVVGWAGEAQAQSVKLSVDKTEVREDGGAVTIKVTAKTFNAKDEHAALGVERVVQLSATAPFSTVSGLGEGIPELNIPAETIDAPPVEGFGRRFTMTLPTIVIPKDQKEVSVESVFTPIPTNHENNPNVTTGDNPYKATGRILNEDLEITLTGDAGGAVTIAEQPKTITLIDTDKPSYSLLFALSPDKISKEAERTAVTVTGRLDGAKANQTLSFLLRQTVPSEGKKAAGRDADYDIELSTLTIPRKKPNGSTTIYITPKNAGTGTIDITGPGEELMISGSDVNFDGDTRDEWTAPSGGVAPGAQPPEDVFILVTEAGLFRDFVGNDFSFGGSTGIFLVDYDPDGTDDDISQTEYDALTDPPDNSDPQDPDGNSYWAWPEVRDNHSFDLNGDGDTDDFLKVVREKDIFHPLEVEIVDFEITDTALAATKGLTATPNVIRESLVGQEEESREVAVKLDIEIEKALPDDARVRFFVRDELTSLPEDFTADAQKATGGTDYTATVDDLVIPAGEKKASTTMNLTVFDNDGKNAAKVLRVEAKVGTVSKFAGIKIADDETATTNIALSVDPSEIKAETGDRNVTITGTLNGDVFDEDKKITLVIVGGDKAATRDTEYTAVLRSLTIPAGETTGSTTVTVTALAGGDKKVWIGSVKNDPFTTNIDDDPVLVSAVAVVLKNADPSEEAEDPGALKFAVDLASTVYDGMVGTAIEVIELPEAEGGEGDRTYSVSNNLPAGLEFDADDLTISGTPTAVGEAEVVYTVLDSEGSAATKLTIDIVAAAPPTVSVESVATSQTSVRESGETASISIKATLSGPAPEAETIRFTLGAPSEGVQAVRDVDFTAQLHGNVAIAAGATEATTSLTLTPINNENTDGNRVLGVHATASGGSDSADITIADDETASTSISLSADPHTVSENASVTEVSITATLDGKVLDADATVTLSVDPASEATRDVDYSVLFDPILTIPAGSVSGSIDMLIDPTSDTSDEGNETITLNGAIADLADGTGTITLADYEMMEDDDMMMGLAFAEGTMVDDVASTAGAAMPDVVLPAAEGGSGDIAYSVSEFPAGLSFDPATRTISGTPEAAGTTEVTYTATDSEGATATLTFSITVNPMLDFGDLGALFGAFNGGAGKRVPMLAGLNADARMYLDARTAMPIVGEDFVLDVRVADFVAVRGYGLQVQYEADKLAFVQALTDQPLGGSAFATPQVLSDEAGVLTVVALGDVVSEGEVALSLVFRAKMEIENTVIEITDSQTYDSEFGFNRLVLPAPVQLQTRPEAFALVNNYPNPFNPATTIKYALPQAADVELTVYNVVGQPVRMLVAEHQSAGRYVVEWDATNDSGHSLSSGMYFYRLQAGGEFHEVKKMLLLK